MLYLCLCEDCVNYKEGARLGNVWEAIFRRVLLVMPVLNFLPMLYIFGKKEIQYEIN